MNIHLKKALRARLIAVASYLAIVIALPIFIWLNHQHMAFKATSLILWWLPLTIALPGMFKGKTYTYGWTGFIILLPFFYAFYYIIEPDKLFWSVSIVVLSIIYFLTSMSYIKQYALSQGIKTNAEAKKVKGIE
ncbi:DUF2069 domain-containing protein [Kangiella sp. HZ709]|uniref:DUF2069 domain-containing protein n=1 Tax=Kangiella sp. HZ709 TaxID=2666328 RepID=UPI0012AF8021|nr:DUF2069 domain-containing protein [Kangiella sp. HZ709]MRX27082.1 DUF2069 domain-containing protein [Kangiella sp. HZ709]